MLSPVFSRNGLKALTIFLLISLSYQQSVTIRNVGCSSFDKSGKCTSCSLRYYLDAAAICQPVNPNCNTYNPSTGACLSCYTGFGLIEDTCLPGIVSASFDANCNTFSGNICVKCSQGYFLNSNGKCQGVDPSCRTFNDKNGQCLSCFSGFQVLNGSCIVSQKHQNIPNCNKIDSVSGKCIKCSFGYYFDQLGNCKQSDPNCKSFDQTQFRCIGCYPGYNLDSTSQCVKNQAVQGDPNCAKYGANNVCVQCSKGAVFNTFNVCIIVDPSCLTFDQASGNCTSCYSGYTLQRGTSICVLSVEGSNPNPYCSKWVGLVCQTCSVGSYFNSNGICILVDSNCKSSNGGICSSCYDGYVLLNNSCIKSENQGISDALCFKWTGNVCSQCSSGSYLNVAGICTLVNLLCKTFNPSTGRCLSCYIGYDLSLGDCQVSNATASSDPYCKTFLAGICSVCSDRYYIGVSGLCTQVNPQCKEYNSFNGRCTTCFPGFGLDNGGCSIAVASVSDPNCKTWNGSKCVQCSFGAYFSQSGFCLLANPLCRSFSLIDGTCLSCYDSFSLINGGCVKENQTLGDPNCAQFLQGICTKCSSGFIFQSNGLCGIVNANCKTFDIVNGACLSCYVGFNLIGSSCILGDSNNLAIDPNCAAFSSGVCVRCSKNFYFGRNGNCLVVNPLCNTFDQTNGNCLSCYQSYVLISGSCIEDQNHASTDSNCASWFQGVCTSCAVRSFMNNAGVCQSVNINCNTYDSNNGTCTSCYSGFSLSRGLCAASSSPNSCSQFDSLGNCVKCGQGSYLNQGQCLIIDPQCASFDIASQSCSACYSGYSLLNGVCQISKVESQYTVENCYSYDINNLCIHCFDRFYLSNNSCKAVNVFCKAYDSYTGNCLSCYSSFTLTNGNCTQ